MKSLPVCLLLILSAVAAMAAESEAPPAGRVLAWVRFDDAGQTYAGAKYRFLGDGDLKLAIDVAPAAGQALDIRCGAKNDQRGLFVVADGATSKLGYGGYDGYRWQRVALPGKAAGDRRQVVLRGDAPKAAFLAEIRLVALEQPAAAPDMTAAVSKIAVEAGKATVARGEVFPEMRAFWDRQPAVSDQPPETPQEKLFRQAERNGRLAAEGLYRCRRFVDGWLQHADPKTGLIPRNLNQNRDLWNGRDAAADNYPFMVLTCALTDRAMFEGRMRDMLNTEIRLTSRLDRLMDNFSFTTQSFATAQPNLDQIVFDNAEYVKDGLAPVTEWLGPSPWSERMVGLVEDIWKHAPIDTPGGKIPTRNFEVNGDLLQACSRLYFFTGERKFLDWAIRLGDYYLLGDQHPTRSGGELSMSDHACEMINGLSELYVAVSVAAPEKKKAYEKPLREIYDCILAHARNEHGLLFHRFNPQTGKKTGRLVDTWGYNYDGVYTMSLVDGIDDYRAAVRHVLSNLKEHYTGHDWGGSDGYADSLEGAINLYNREPIASAAEWIDSEIRTMWSIQKADGVIEGWHGDGNFARTTIMHALLKSQGLSLRPWRADVCLGAVCAGDTLYVSLSADEPWEGEVVFDRPRHRVFMRLPMDYPRINQFPEWFTVEAEKTYVIRPASGADEAARTVSGQQMQSGVKLRLEPGKKVRWTVTAGG